jgi:hypothetical protein
MPLQICRLEGLKDTNFDDLKIPSFTFLSNPRLWSSDFYRSDRRHFFTYFSRKKEYISTFRRYLSYFGRYLSNKKEYSGIQIEYPSNQKVFRCIKNEYM